MQSVDQEKVKTISTFLGNLSRVVDRSFSNKIFGIIDDHVQEIDFDTNEDKIDLVKAYLQGFLVVECISLQQMSLIVDFLLEQRDDNEDVNKGIILFLFATIQTS